MRVGASNGTLPTCIKGCRVACTQIFLDVSSVAHCIGLYASPCFAQSICCPPKCSCSASSSSASSALSCRRGLIDAPKPLRKAAVQADIVLVGGCSCPANLHQVGPARHTRRVLATLCLRDLISILLVWVPETQTPGLERHFAPAKPLQPLLLQQSLFRHRPFRSPRRPRLL